MHKYYDGMYVDQDKLISNIKWSHHSYIYHSLSNISLIEKLSLSNSYSINNKDLLGKYCALNFLLDLFLTNQNSRMIYYPDNKNRNKSIDFCYIAYFLYKNGARGNVPDYKKHTFDENISSYLYQIEAILIKDNEKFVPNNFQSFIFSTLDEKKDFLINLLNDKNLEHSEKYQHLYLSLLLKDDNKQLKKLKI